MVVALSKTDAFHPQQKNAVGMDDFMVKYDTLKREAKQLMERGAIHAYIQKLMEIEQIDRLYQKRAWMSLKPTLSALLAISFRITF